LAVLVLLSHVGVNIFGYGIGDMAVIAFYLLSGYVMTILINNYYASNDRIFAFYVDRAARLFPQFVAYCIMTLMLMKYIGFSTVYLENCSAKKIMMNFAMLPLNFFNLIVIGDCMLIPQAWSLGLELCFYIFIPIIIVIINRAIARTIISLLSIGIFMLAYFGIINTEIYGFRLLPGTLFIFLTGAALAAPNLLIRYFVWIVWAWAISLFSLMYIDRMLLSFDGNKEVLAGLIIGIPVVAFLCRFRFSVYDEWLGNLSYGIFLNHFLCIWLLQSTLVVKSNSILYIITLITLSSLLSGITYYFVERPALKWRHRMRYPSASTVIDVVK
jgi:peptidoglycan/LPS O-acetylase OafA/YrhL